MWAVEKGLGGGGMGELCFEGMGAVERWWHWVKCVLLAWGQLKRGFEVVALGEMCFHGMGAVEKVV